jgi:phenylacetate-CoA ligase
MNTYSEIIGRIEDVIIGEDGREMVRFHGIFIDINSIIEGQVIQHDVNKFEIKIVTTRNLKIEEINLIKKRMISQLGNEIEINIIEVNEIEKGSNGKFKAVISKINRN